MKLGIIGSGKIVHDFLTIANKIESLEIVGISSTKKSEGILKKLQTEYSIPHIYTDNELLLNNVNIDTIYVAVPNILHFEMCKVSLEHGKNVICEKPLVYTENEARKLKSIADDKNKYIIEAITNIYLPNYEEIKNNIKTLGKLHIVNFNYTQYSTRYGDFKKGKILPVFDPNKGGGALMDLGIYDLHLAVALFGVPQNVEYISNRQRNTDTSGIILMNYPNMICVMIAAKDSFALPKSFIEGENGSIVINGLINQLPSLSIHYRDGTTKDINSNKYSHRMVSEFTVFVDMIDNKRKGLIEKMFSHSLDVLKVLEMAKDNSR